MSCLIFTLALCSSVKSQTLGFGTSYLNQTVNGERGQNVLATDFQFQLDAPDAGASYHARLHDDAVIWSRLEVGPRYGNIQAFYSLDLINGMWLNGGGVMVSQRLPSSQINLTGGVYDRGFCFEGSCAFERAGFIGRLGYEYRKLEELRWFGPSVSVGWRW